MLIKQNRLKLRDDAQFFSRAERISGRGFTLFIKKQSHSLAQFTCIVSKKTHSLAVGRNALKRRGRALFAELLKKTQIAPFEYVLVLQKNFALQDKAFILRELQDKLNKVYSSTGK